MAGLKEKAKARNKTKSSSNGSLAAKAKSRTPAVKMQRVEDIKKEQGIPPAPATAEAAPMNLSPPVPPALAYIRKFATIPGLRKERQGE